MMNAKGVWIGADPGGKRNFGLAIIAEGGSAQTWSVDCADKVIGIVTEKVTLTPSGIGVDAPLWWSSGHSSDRQADQWLRSKYQLSGGQVQTANSLRGAALVQGMMFVQRIRERFPGVNVTEAHPKAILVAMKKSSEEFFEHFCIKDHGSNDHERDAIISAVAARE